MGAASTLSYNGIEIGYITTKGFKQEPIYDTSHTDLLYNKITLTVSGVINYAAQAAGKLPIPSKVPTYGCSAPQEVVQIRQRMLTPRGLLIYTVDGVELIRSPNLARNQLRDENNGPKPIRFDIVKLDGGKTIFVEFEIETCINECSEDYYNCSTTAARQGSQKLISNRWSCSSNLDNNYLQTRTTQGTLVLSGANNVVNEGLPELIQSQVVLLPIPAGWKRESISITQEADTLTYKWQIVDKELQIAMPAPLVSIDAQYTQVFGVQGAGVTENEINISLQGKPGSKYGDLLAIASRVIWSRISLSDINNPGSPEEKKNGLEWITGGSITEDIFNRKLTLKVKTKRGPPETVEEGQLNWLIERLGKEIPIQDIKNNKARQPNNYNTYLIACGLSGPCEISTGTPTKTKKTSNAKEEPVQKVYEPTQSSRYKETGWSKEQTANPYTPDTTYEYNLETNHYTFQLPVASVGNVMAQFATVASPTSVKKIRWIASRTGKPPELPYPITGEYLLKSWIFPQNPTLHEDGKTWVYSVRGEYWYGLAAAYNYTGIELPRNPTYKGVMGQGQNQVSAAQFRKDILTRYS